MADHSPTAARVLGRLPARVRAILPQEDGGVPIAISSEFAVECFDWEVGRYLEVLDHAPGSVDLTRADLQDGIALLADHDRAEWLGKVRQLQVGEDRTLRGVAYFSASEDAQTIRADMLAGLRTEISVGYDPGDQYTQTEDETGRIVRRFTGWQPLEVSTVAIPADPTVGVGRSIERPAALGAALPPEPAPQARSITMSDKTSPAPEAGAPPVSRAAIIADMCDAAGLTVREARELDESGKSLREISDLVVAKARGAAPTVAAPKAPAFDPSPKEEREFSLVRAINAHLSGDYSQAGYEREVTQELERNLGGARKGGILIPNITRAGRALLTRAALQISTATKGPELKQTTFGALIDMLYPASILMSRLGATVLPDLVGDFSAPRITAGMTAYWVGEGPANDTTESSPTFDNMTLAPKMLTATTSASRKALRQTTPALEQVLRRHITQQHATGVDKAGLAGATGGDNPVGVLYATGTNLVTHGSTGGNSSLAKLIEMQKEVEIDNGLTDGCVFVTTPGVKAWLRQTARIASTDSRTLWDDGDMTPIGAAVSTNNLPSNLTKSTGSNLHAALYGDFRRVVLGFWGAEEIIVDEVTRARKGEVVITSFQFSDVNVEQPSAFAVARDISIA